MNRLTPSAVAREEGEIASTLMIFLGVLAFFMLTVHATFVYHGNNVIKAAAQDTLAVAQRALSDVAEPPGEATLEQVGHDRLDLFPGLTNRDVDVTIDYDTNTVSVTVKAKITTPWLTDAFADLETTIEGPIERFLEENQRQG